MTAGQRDLGSVVSLPAHSLRAAWCHYSAAKQSTLGHGTLQSFLNLRVSPMREEGGVRQRHGHPQPLPPSHQVGQWRNAAGTRMCLSLLWAPREKGLKPQVLHGNEHCSLCRVGKLMLSHGRVHLSREVRSSPPQPSPTATAPGPPPALRDGGPGGGGLGTTWTAPADGAMPVTAQCESPAPPAARSLIWQDLGTPGYTSFPDTRAFP